jgi:hypothetical protein
MEPAPTHALIGHAVENLENERLNGKRGEERASTSSAPKYRVIQL